MRMHNYIGDSLREMTGVGEKLASFQLWHSVYNMRPNGRQYRLWETLDIYEIDI